MWYLKRIRKREFFLSGEFLRENSFKKLEDKEIKIEEFFLTVDIFNRDQINENYMVNAKLFPLTPYTYTFKLEILNLDIRKWHIQIFLIH